MDLLDLGWNAHFARPFDALSLPDLEPARVARHHRTYFGLLGPAGEVQGVLPGAVRIDAERDDPAVGDWVAYEPVPGEAKGRIRAVLPRRSTLLRKAAGDVTRAQVLAANVDTVFIVAGLDGDFNLRRLERYVTQVWNSGAEPILLLNKADVCEDVAGRLLAAEAAAPGVPVHALSAATGEGLPTLDGYLSRGRTVAFVGSSGVGKSTLVNHLLGADTLATQAVRASDSRGRHTTTARALFLRPAGGLVIDMPGLREFGVWEADEGLEETFGDLEALAPACRFRDCSHEDEPGCAVQAALAEGRLDPARYHHYLKLKKELAYLARRQDEAAAFQQRRYEKALSKQYRKHLRKHPKR